MFNLQGEDAHFTTLYLYIFFISIFTCFTKIFIYHISSVILLKLILIKFGVGNQWRSEVFLCSGRVITMAAP